MDKEEDWSVGGYCSKTCVTRQLTLVFEQRPFVP